MPFCTNCGSKLPEGTKFCPECGMKQDLPASAAQPEPAAEGLNFDAGPETVPVTLSEPDFAGDTIGSAPVPPPPAAPRAWSQPSLEETEPLNEPEPVEMPTEPLEEPVPVSAPVQAAPAVPAAKQARKPMPKWLKLLIIFGSIGLALIVGGIIAIVSIFNRIKAAVTPDVTGTWEAVTVAANGQKYEIADITDDAWTLSLEKGGKCELNLGTEPLKGKWELDEDGDFEIEIDSAEYEGTLLNDTLQLNNFNIGGSLGSVVFAREGSVPMTDPVTEPAVGPAATTEPAGGSARTYAMYAANIGGFTYDLATLRQTDMDKGTLVLNADGTGTMSYLGQPEVDITWEDDDIHYYGMDLDAEFEGDTVTVDINGTKITYMKEGSPLLTEAETTPAETTPAETEPAELPAIEIPSDWTGTVAFSDFWGMDLEDYSDEAALTLGLAGNGRPFAEICLADDPDTIFVSLWVIPEDGRLTADIGEKDAWVHETYLTAFDGEDYNLYMNEDGHLTMSFDFVSDDDDAFGCHMEMDFVQDAGTASEPETTAAAVTGEGEWSDPSWYGEGIADAKTLADAWEYRSSGEKITYEEMVAFIGCKGQCYVSDYINPEHLNVIWYTPDKDGLLKLEFKPTDDGLIYWQGNTSGTVTSYYD